MREGKRNIEIWEISMEEGKDGYWQSYLGSRGKWGRVFASVRCTEKEEKTEVATCDLRPTKANYYNNKVSLKRAVWRVAFFVWVRLESNSSAKFSVYEHYARAA